MKGRFPIPWSSIFPKGIICLFILSEIRISGFSVTRTDIIYHLFRRLRQPVWYSLSANGWITYSVKQDVTSTFFYRRYLLLLQDNSPRHVARITLQKRTDLGYETLTRPLYCLDHWAQEITLFQASWKFLYSKLTPLINLKK